jgi:geranylgeranylglycerol-phosphate geranylgeranyltransferase
MTHQEKRISAMLKFIKAYVKSMRLYYSFITGIAGWIGVAYYEYLATHPLERTIEIVPPPEKKFVILLLLFLSWGINQIINDYLGLKEDKINAPDRPMVNGELDPKKAMMLSAVLLAVSAAITWFYLEPIAVVFLFAGVLLNVLYEYSKSYGIAANVVFGLMIAMATLYGGFAAGPTQASVFQPYRFSPLILIWLINGLMTFFTYFKDYRGDKKAGKNTIVVQYGLGKAKTFAILSAFLPTLAFFILRATHMLWDNMNRTFFLLAGLTVFLQIWTGVLYYLNPIGEKTYSSLKTNFRACACGEAAIIAFFNPDLALWLFIMAYIFVGFLFDFHSNPKA